MKKIIRMVLIYFRYLVNKYFYVPSILIWIDKMFKNAEKRQWFETYFCFDIHGVISKPDYRRETKEINYYPYVKETLQLLSKRKDIIMFVFTSSYPEEVKQYMKTFELDNIFFKYVNENPEISSEKGSFGYYDKKPYFNVLFEDKAGFKSSDWIYVYNYFKNTKYRPNPKWTFKTDESYHKK